MITNTNVCFTLSFRVFKKASPNGKVSVEGAGPDTPGLILIGSSVAPPPAHRLPGEERLRGSGGSGGTRR